MNSTCQDLRRRAAGHRVPRRTVRHRPADRDRRRRPLRPHRPVRGGRRRASRRWSRATAAPTAPKCMRFPPGMNRTQFREERLSEELPAARRHGALLHAATTADHRALLADAGAGEDWTQAQKATEIVLTPAACYPLYPAVAKRGPLPRGRARCSICSPIASGTSRRSDPARMQLFRDARICPHGHARAGHGVPRDLAGARPEMIGDRSACRAKSTSPTIRSSAAPASMLADNQRDQRLKFELLIPIDERREADRLPVSFNYHQDHFGTTLGPHDGRRRSGAHGLRRLRHGAHRAGALQASRPRREGLAGRRAQGALGLSAMTGASLLRDLDPDDLPPHALHAFRDGTGRKPIAMSISGSRCCSAGPRARGGLRLHRGAGFRGRPVHLLQVAARRISKRCTACDVRSWRSIDTGRGHVEEQLARGRLLLVEIDAFYIRRYPRHRLSAGAWQDDDRDQRHRPRRPRLGYFHNAGYFEADGDDVEDARLRLCAAAATAAVLEFVKSTARVCTARRLAALRAAIRRALSAAAENQSGRCLSCRADTASRPAGERAVVLVPPLCVQHRPAVRRQHGAAGCHLAWLDGEARGGLVRPLPSASDGDRGQDAPVSAGAGAGPQAFRQARSRAGCDRA